MNAGSGVALDQKIAVDSSAAGSHDVADVSAEEAIKLTDRAVACTVELARLPEYSNYGVLRIYLAGKGCSGFNYGVQFDDQRPEDLLFPQAEGVMLVCDADSYVFLKGALIDYVDDERGKGYWVENPHHRRYRGKFYKKKMWQEALQQRKESRSSGE